MVSKIKAYVTSIGETTTDLCIWALERNGFEVVLIKDNSTLCNKLAEIYNKAHDDFLRVDADVVVNKNCTESNIYNTAEIDSLKDAWWIQFRTFGWFQLDLTHGGVQFVKKEALPYLRDNVNEYLTIDRPETELSRIYEFYNPRRFETNDLCMGIHGYGQADVERVKNIKIMRGQIDNYDFELSDRLSAL